jgi:tryptophanyl-tRNA synthetase
VEKFVEKTFEKSLEKSLEKSIDQKIEKVFSGIQPTGNLHLGNYLGAITNWLELQDKYHCLFGVMDLHAITVKQDPSVLRHNVLLTVATYIACGLDLKKAKIFVQSEVAQHSQLAWVLNTITPLGWLNRMTQFKDKIGDDSAINANLGLYSYPVLMASDILLYQTDIVPVGEDQKQHVELTRDIAQAFNRNFNVEYFKLPKPLIIKEVKRIMSLQDGSKKMSKSDPSEISRINLTDSSDEISKKIKKAKTDSQSMIAYDEDRREIYNLLNIFASFAKKNPQEIALQYQDLGYGKFKNDLADVLISKLEPISQEIKKLLNDQKFLEKTIEDGRNYANEIAKKTCDKVFDIIGLGVKKN